MVVDTFAGQPFLREQARELALTVTKYRQVMLSSCGVSVGSAQHIGTLTATASLSSAAAVAGLHGIHALIGAAAGASQNILGGVEGD